MTDDQLLTWQPEYSVHIDSIDRQHQALIGMIRQLKEAMWEGRGQEFQRTLINRLVTYVGVHFEFEQQLLAKMGCATLAEHTALHQTLTNQVLDLQKRIHESGAVSNASLMMFMRHLLTDHILGRDRPDFAALQSVPAGTSATSN